MRPCSTEDKYLKLPTAHKMEIEKYNARRRKNTGHLLHTRKLLKRELHEALGFLTYLDKTNLSIRHSNQSDEGNKLLVHNYTVRAITSLQLGFAQKNLGGIMCG